MSAALSMRTVESVSASFSFMALTISAWIRSAMLGSVMAPSGLRSRSAESWGREDSTPRAGGRRVLPAPHRRHDADLAPRRKRRREPTSVAYALVSDEHLNVLADLARLGHDAIADGGELAPEGGERDRSEEHTAELQSLAYLVCR